MINKLRFKFIATNMSLVSIVLLISFTILYFNSARELSENSINAMHDIANSDHGGLDYLFEPNINNESRYGYISAFIIDYDDKNDTYRIDGFGDVENLSDEQLSYIKGLISAIDFSKEEEGILEEYNMRYYTSRFRFGIRTVLIDKRYEDDQLKRLLASFAVAGTVAFSAFLLISVIISKITVKPIEKSIKQQQQLVSDASHELKTPITVIAANTDIVLSHPETTVREQEKWLRYIKDETNRMSELVRSLLYLAKSDEGGDLTELKDIDLSNIAYEAALPFESTCFEQNKIYNINIEPNIHINADPFLIKELIVILLDNAIKYSDENGTIELCLSTQHDKALITVFNTGEPIPQESISRIFERFYRVDASRTRGNKKGGSGLGLAIAKRITETCKGDISVSSNTAQGTIFTCCFKIIKKQKALK